MYTFVQFQETKVPLESSNLVGVVRTMGGGVDEVPLILVVEDEYPIQGIIEDALIEAGFGADILSSGEEALTLFLGKLKTYRALVTDVALKGRGNCRPDQRERPLPSRNLHERRTR